MSLDVKCIYSQPVRVNLIAAGEGRFQTRRYLSPSNDTRGNAGPTAVLLLITIQLRIKYFLNLKQAHAFKVNILGIETSCDETAASVVVDGTQILSNVIASQAEMHSAHGGIVPELASRQHILAISPVIREAVVDASLSWPDIDAVAVTSGPGLAGALIVGVNAAKGLAASLGVPLIGVNHLEGHLKAAWLAEEFDVLRDNPEFPLMGIIVSGGHTELVVIHNHTQYELVGATRDDAAGEAFDKCARIMGMPYPGGPEISRVAERHPDLERLPRAWIRQTHDFSFSGLKTALLRRAEDLGLTDEGRDVRLVAGLSHELQESIVDVLVTKTLGAAEAFDCNGIIVGGGVAANGRLREQFHRQSTLPVFIPPPVLCTDNGAMIAAAAYHHLMSGESSGFDLDVDPSLRLGKAA